MSWIIYAIGGAIFGILVTLFVWIILGGATAAAIKFFSED